MEEKGEFEQRSEMKPAESMDLPKAKASPVAKSLCVFFALIAVGLGAFILYDKVINPTMGSTTKCDQSSKEADKTAETTKKVKDMIVDVRVMLIKMAEGEDYTLNQRYDDNTPTYEFQEGYATGLESSFGLTFYIEPSQRHDQVTEKNNLKASVETILKKYGLSKTEVTDPGRYGDVAHYKSDDGYICVAMFGGMPFYLDCGHTSWLSDTKKELVKKLADVYKASLEGERSVIYIDADPENIETATGGEYQRIQVSLGDAAGLFYRKGAEGEWKFFTATQQFLDCSAYDTDELKAAYEGVDCYDIETEKSSTVK